MGRWSDHSLYSEAHVTFEEDAGAYDQKPTPPASSSSTRCAPVLVDGSNVMYWRDNTPRLDTLREVVARLEASGYAPSIVFDANAGYLLGGKYQHDPAMARHLDLPEGRVMVVPKGTIADQFLLRAARDCNAPHCHE